jgi:chromosome condensin MukBEF complex kleisin-like MukF subunit
MATNRRGIPAVRDRLYELADELDIEELRELADQLWRKSARKRAPIRSPKLTPEMAEEIRQYAADNPDAHQQDIAEKFGVNHGRISEALDGQI